MYYKDFINHPHFFDPSPPGKQTHFAVGYIGKQKLIGYNKNKTNPNFVWKGSKDIIVSSIHAEIDVLAKIPLHKRKDLVLYVTRLKRKSNNGYTIHDSRPCCHCIDFLIKNHVKLKNIWYTDSNGKWTCLKDTYGDEDEILARKHYCVSKKAERHQSSKR